jgi:hypothetical protein
MAFCLGAAFKTKRTVSKNSKMFSASKLVWWWLMWVETCCNNHSEKQLFVVFLCSLTFNKLNTLTEHNGMDMLNVTFTFPFTCYLMSTMEDSWETSAADLMRRYNFFFLSFYDIQYTLVDWNTRFVPITQWRRRQLKHRNLQKSDNCDWLVILTHETHFPCGP